MRQVRIGECYSSSSPHLMRPLFLLLFLPLHLLSSAQDKINLMNGQIIEGRVLGQSTLEVRYVPAKFETRFLRKGESLDSLAEHLGVSAARLKDWNHLTSDSIQKGQRFRFQRPEPAGTKWKERSEPTESVFSVTDSLGKEKIWYFMDTVFGNDLSIPQMRWYMAGERDARKGYKPWGPMIGGFLLGAGAVIAMDLEVNSLIIPPAYAGLMAWPRVNVTRGSISDPAMEGDEFYAMGYNSAGRPKRVIKSLISSALGVAVGLAVRQLIINPNQDSGY